MPLNTDANAASNSLQGASNNVPPPPPNPPGSTNAQSRLPNPPGNTVGLPLPNQQKLASGGSLSNSQGQPNQIVPSLTNQEGAINNLIDLMSQQRLDFDQRQRDSEQRHREQMLLMTKLSEDNQNHF